MLTGAAGSSLGAFAGAAAALAAVVLLILLAARAARHLPALRQASAAQGAISLRGSLALDTRRRLHLIEAGGHQALVLTGGASDVMIGLPSPRP